nr:hypothetical protein [Anaerolineae bacterium]
MDTVTRSIEELRRLFTVRMCWTIAELGETLKRPVVSVRRLLARLGYWSSFTHNSRWYTLSGIPRFDRDGLWFCGEVGFSRQATLSATLTHLVDRSPAGLTAQQLGAKLRCRCHGILVQLHRQGRLQREKVGASYVYLSAEPDVTRTQREALQRHRALPTTLAAEVAVLALAAFIRSPEASDAELARQVGRQSGVTVRAGQIQRLLQEHDIKRGGPVRQPKRSRP